MSNRTNIPSVPATNNGYVIVNPRYNTEQDDSRNTSVNNDHKSDPSDTEVVRTKKDSCWRRLCSWRSLIIALMHLSYCLNIMPVVTMSMALVCMCGPVGAPSNQTLQNTSKLLNVSTYGEYNPADNSTRFQEKIYEFSWDSETRGLLISGYLFTVFLVPQLCNIVRRYLGNKLTLTLFSLALAFLNFIGPLAARTSVNLFLAVRILTGLCINANVPIFGDMLAWWLPVHEKLTSATLVVSGWIVGGSLGPVVAGYFCAVPINNGWPLIFYFNGALTVAWTIAWYFLSSRKPDTHPFISQKEKMYIVAHRVGMDQASTQEVDKPPYLTILTSRPFLAFVISSICYLWAMIITITCLPLYLTSVLQFSLTETGILFSVMSALRLPAMLLWSAFGNWLLRLKFLSTNSVRKICFMLSEALASVFCLAASFLDAQHRWAASVLVIGSVTFASSGTVMASVIPLDMAPRYAGFITGVSTSLSCLASITAPMFTTAVTANGLYEEWRAVWITMAVVNFSAGFVFVVFGNASLQPWAVSKTYNSTSKTKVEYLPDQIQEDISATLKLCPQSE